MKIVSLFVVLSVVTMFSCKTQNMNHLVQSQLQSQDRTENFALESTAPILEILQKVDLSIELEMKADCEDEFKEVSSGLCSEQSESIDLSHSTGEQKDYKYRVCMTGFGHRKNKINYLDSLLKRGYLPINAFIMLKIDRYVDRSPFLDGCTTVHVAHKDLSQAFPNNFRKMEFTLNP